MSQWELWLPFAIFVGITGFFFVLIMAACLWEKHPILHCVVPEAGTEYEPSDIARRANIAAERLEFRHLGVCHDNKGKIYRIRYDLWISPDDVTLAVIGSGTVAKIAVNGIWLWSRTKDDTLLRTTNEIGEQDISGILEQQTWPKLKLSALYEKHLEFCLEHEIRPFDSERPMADYFSIRREIADALVARGLAAYLDEECSVWRYNLWGALTFYCVGTWIRPIQRGLRSLGISGKSAHN